MIQEEHKFWVALASAAAWVYLRHRGKSYIERLAITAISSGLGASLADELARETGRGKILAVVVITVSIWVVLDIGSSILADKQSIKDALLRRLSGGGGKK